MIYYVHLLCLFIVNAAGYPCIASIGLFSLYELYFAYLLMMDVAPSRVGSHLAARAPRPKPAAKSASRLCLGVCVCVISCGDTVVSVGRLSPARSSVTLAGRQAVPTRARAKGDRAALEQRADVAPALHAKPTPLKPPPPSPPHPPPARGVAELFFPQMCITYSSEQYYSCQRSISEIYKRESWKTFGNRILGVMAWLMPLSVTVSTFGSANGTLFAAGRLCFAASREGHLLDILSYVHVRRYTPAPGLIFHSLIAVAMVMSGTIDSLIDFFSFTAWIFYGGSMLALLVMRKTKPHTPRPYKVPIIIPLIVLVICDLPHCGTYY
ncbi:B(0,+)-type amino acid transporter 1 [Gryllus bimaculatus]|nr:B(0,+)-type amino acid transporter 1 [Gryllus bimaculatus]